MEIIDKEELRRVQIGILNHFDVFCKENELTYFLSNGTLLGAVKYQGYIPWDDDIDVCMPRESYDRLLKMYGKEPRLNFRLLYLNDQQHYYFPFAKLVDTRTSLIEQGVLNPTELGVNIDIFPLDPFGEDMEQAKCVFKQADTLRRKLLFSKLTNFNGKPWKRLAKKYLVNLYSRAHGNGRMYYCEALEKLARSTRSDTFVGNVVWGFYSGGEFHSKDIFSCTVEVNFEGRNYPAPVGYDAYLRRLYGDYHRDPPAHKQVTHHGFTAYYKENI